MLEMGVVKGGEVFLLEEKDVKVALRAGGRQGEGKEGGEQEGL
jgi:hypothetical protein